MGNQFISTQEYHQQLKYYFQGDEFNKKQFKELEKVVQEKISLFGENHKEVAVAYTNLANLQYNFKIYNEAIANYKKAFEIDQSNYHMLKNYAQALQNIGLQEESIKIFEKMLQIIKTQESDKSPKFVETLRQIAVSYQLDKEFEKKIQIQQAVLENLRNNFGGGSAEVAKQLEEIGHSYVSLKELDRAYVYFRDALNIKRDVYGEEHIEVANANGNIGEVYLKQMYFEKAQSYFDIQLRMIEKLQGKESQDLILPLSFLGDVHFYKKEITNAIYYQERTLHLITMHYGTDNKIYATGLHNVARSYSTSADFIDQGLRAFDMAIKIFEAYPEFRNELGECLNDYGNAYMVKQDFQKALEIHRKSLERSNSFYGHDNPESARALQNIAGALYFLNKKQECLETLKECWKMRKNLYGSKHESVKATEGAIQELEKFLQEEQ